MSHLPSGIIPTIIIVMVMVVMVFLTVKLGVAAGLGLAALPLFLLGLIVITVNPYISYIALFLVSYFVIPLIRYSGIGGWSVLFDALILITTISLVLNRVFKANEAQKIKIHKGLLVVTGIWVAYCVIEVLNPTGMLSAWLLSRSLVFYQLIIVLLTFWIVDDFRKINTILLMLSAITILGFAKAIMQKVFGFDAVENALLAGDLGKTHLLPTGIRYFSFYASAGIFGVVMGHAMVIFFICSIYTKSLSKRVWFIIVALLSLYGLLISGTRGALAVPAAGFVLFVLLSKRIKIIIPTVIVMIGVYLFLAMTTIGQGNATIRRMRTVFDPKEPSLMVRLDNQKKLGEYLAHRPFGEGLGLSGVEAQDISMRFTTSIPTDSWYVKIWVETGIVGLCIYLAMMIYILLYGSYLILFKVRDIRIRGVMTAFLCGFFGVLVSSYGNAVLGQYPVAMIVYVSVAFIFMAPYLDRKLQLSGGDAKF